MSGYVYDNSTNLPIENANVYISHTTFGAPTDEYGYYIIESIPVSIHELVVSVIGYKDTSKIFLIKSRSNVKLNFKLNPKIYSADSITVIAEKPDEWRYNLELFKKKFIGQFIFADKCMIKNEEVLDFENTNSFFTATAQTPLIIYNSALGYKLNCILKEFAWNIKDETWKWEVMPEFKKITPRSEHEKNIWENNRNIAHRNSIYHFLASLVNNNTEKDGYQMYYNRKPSKEKLSGPLALFSVHPQLITEKGLIDTELLLHFPNYLKIIDTKSDNDDKTSWLRLNYEKITLDEFGYPQEKSPFRVYGFWAKLGVADLLPKYYELE